MTEILDYDRVYDRDFREILLYDRNLGKRAPI